MERTQLKALVKDLADHICKEYIIANEDMEDTLMNYFTKNEREGERHASDN